MRENTMSDYQPTIRVRQRNRDAALEQHLLEDGLHPLVARIMAARPLANGASPAEFLTAKLSTIQPPDGLPNVDKAAQRIAKAIIEQEHVAFVSDYDNDGQVALCVFANVLDRHFNFPMESFTPFIGERLTEGYGLSDMLCDRILASSPLPSLVITGDCGSSDESRIRRLKDAGCDVMVSDHHVFPESGFPVSAYAVVSPVHPDSQYDPMVAGGMVTWLLMTRVRQALIDCGYLPPDVPRLGDMLDFVASATVADCVGMNSQNNRTVVKAGLALINAKTRPAWEAFLKHRGSKQIRASDCAFSLSPMLNSDGRLSNALGSVSFLLSPDRQIAEQYLAHLISSNEERKCIEREATRKAKILAAAKLTVKSRSIIVYLEDGHPGVSGIVASRLREYFGRPAIVLAPSGQVAGQAVGSARSIDYASFHILKALRLVQGRHPDLLTKAGGHKGAAGISLSIDDIDTFALAFEAACDDQLGDIELGPVIETDGSLDGYTLDLALLEILDILEPTGRGFETPIFELSARVLEMKPIGKTKTHAQLTLQPNGQPQRLIATWFNARDNTDLAFPIDKGTFTTFVGNLSINEWRGTRTVRFNIHHFVRFDDD